MRERESDNLGNYCGKMRIHLVICFCVVGVSLTTAMSFTRSGRQVSFLFRVRNEF